MDINSDNSPLAPQGLLSVQEAARFLGISRAKLYEHFAAGEIQARKNGRRTVLFKEELEAFKAALPVAHFRKPGGFKK